jgi:hypothetical protein
MRPPVRWSLAAAALAAASAWGAGAVARSAGDDRMGRLPAPGPTATPASARSAGADADDGSRENPADAPVATPVQPRLVAALDVEQGEGGERTALFTDNTLVYVARLQGRSVTNRRTISNEERRVIERVVGEALDVREDQEPPSVLLETARRHIRLEVAAPDGTVRTFAFDDVTPVPLAVGRARGALDDLRARFLVKETRKEELWDPDPVKEGDLLRRRADGRWFRVSRDDAFEENLELREVEGSLRRLYFRRADLPKVFEDPAREVPPGGDRR